MQKKIIQKCFHLSISYFWIRFSGFFDVWVCCSSRQGLGGTIFFENLNVNLFWNRESPLKKVNITVGTNFWPNFRPDTKMRNFSLIIGHSRISQISLILKIQQKKIKWPHLFDTQWITQKIAGGMQKNHSKMFSFVDFLFLDPLFGFLRWWGTLLQSSGPRRHNFFSKIWMWTSFGIAKVYSKIWT